jgi:uncharacterized membrane protein YgcG
VEDWGTVMPSAHLRLQLLFVSAIALPACAPSGSSDPGVGKFIEASAAVNSGGYNSGGYNSGGYNSGGYNSGGYNSGGYNSGGYNQGGWSGLYAILGTTAAVAMFFDAVGLIDVFPGAVVNGVTFGANLCGALDYYLLVAYPPSSSSDPIYLNRRWFFAQAGAKFAEVFGMPGVEYCNPKGYDVTSSSGTKVSFNTIGALGVNESVITSYMCTGNTSVATPSAACASAQQARLAVPSLHANGLAAITLALTNPQGPEAIRVVGVNAGVTSPYFSTLHTVGNIYYLDGTIGPENGPKSPITQLEAAWIGTLYATSPASSTVSTTLSTGSTATFSRSYTISGTAAETAYGLYTGSNRFCTYEADCGVTMAVGTIFTLDSVGAITSCGGGDMTLAHVCASDWNVTTYVPNPCGSGGSGGTGGGGSGGTGGGGAGGGGSGGGGGSSAKACQMRVADPKTVNGVTYSGVLTGVCQGSATMKCVNLVCPPGQTC